MIPRKYLASKCNRLCNNSLWTNKFEKVLATDFRLFVEDNPQIELKGQVAL